ncbi:MAG TPA: IS200/IS605 family transposase, partial [Anaerolineales bacterium]|nr:IS200/IS605 family transposase [Anaerolineales bacterium]
SLKEEPDFSSEIFETETETPTIEEDSPQEKEKREIIDLFEFDDDENESFPPISEILENIPAPNPVSVTSEVKTLVPKSTPSPETSQKSVFNEPMPNPFAKARSEIAHQEGTESFYKASSREASPAIRSDEYFETHQQIQVDLAETRVQEIKHQKNGEVDLNLTRVSQPVRPETPIRKPCPEELIETRPHSTNEVGRQVNLEPVSSSMYDLTYACLLVPRFSSHHLIGDISEQLSKWIPSICVAFGWRLEYLSVRPDYLQWVVNVPPTTSPGYLMRIMRKQTSEKIFRNFPRKIDDNPSGDFWAPGYLIMGGSQPHPSKLVEDYIERTRKRQGARRKK